MRRKYKNSFHNLVKDVTTIWIALFGNAAHPQEGKGREAGLVAGHDSLKKDFEAFRNFLMESLTPEQILALRDKLDKRSETILTDHKDGGFKVYPDGEAKTAEAIEKEISRRDQDAADSIIFIKERSGVEAAEAVDWTRLHQHCHFVEPTMTQDQIRHERARTAIHWDRNEREIKVGDEVLVGGGKGRTGTIEAFVFLDEKPQHGPNRDQEIEVKCIIAYDTYPQQSYEGKAVDTEEIKYGIWQYDYLRFKRRPGVEEEVAELPVPIAGSPADLPDWEDLVQAPLACINQSLDINGDPLEHGDVVQILDDKGGLGTVEKIYVAAKFGEVIKPDSQKTADVSFDHFGNEQFKSNKRGDFPILQKVRPR